MNTIELLVNSQCIFIKGWLINLLKRNDLPYLNKLFVIKVLRPFRFRINVSVHQSNT